MSLRAVLLMYLLGAGVVASLSLDTTTSPVFSSDEKISQAELIALGKD